MRRFLILLALISLSCGQYQAPLEPVIDYKAEWLKKVEQFKRELEPHRAGIKKIVVKCSAESQPGATYKVDYESMSICRKPNVYSATQVRFGVSKGVEGKAKIKLELGMEIETEGGRERQLELLSMIRSCIPHAKVLFERYGIDFDLTMSEKIPGLEYDNIVKLIDSDDAPMNSNNWRMHPSSHGDYTAETCGIFFHEIGHLLGGPDEYLATASCPDREYVETSTSPYSIMASGGNFENTDFYLRHIKDMIRPLCEELATAEGWSRQQLYDFRQM
ncbi:MAG: hypothetical protein ABIQ95_03840 [Bdellovibrionia bacterium]